MAGEEIGRLARRLRPRRQDANANAARLNHRKMPRPIVACHQNIGNGPSDTYGTEPWQTKEYNAAARW